MTTIVIGADGPAPELSERLLRVAYHILCDWDLAADCVQTALAEAVRAGGHDTKGRRIGEGWLRACVRARAKDFLRARKRECYHLPLRAETVERLRQSEALRGIDDPARLARVAEAAMLVHSLLDGLKPPIRREILRLVFDEGLSLTEVGARLGRDKSVISRHMNSALVSLRKRLSADGTLDLLREMLP